MTGTRDWDKELAKVDRQIGSMSDADLLAASQAQRPTEKDASAGAIRAATAPARAGNVPGKWGVYARVGMALVLGVGLLFWPYDTRCGLGLFGYLLAAFMTSVTGVWGGIFSWKVRMPAMHTMSIALFLWGGIMGAIEVLPRVGYALANDAHPALWLCR